MGITNRRQSEGDRTLPKLFNELFERWEGRGVRRGALVANDSVRLNGEWVSVIAIESPRSLHAKDTRTICMIHKT
ncbi:MAG: hypothetical protein MKZ94_08760 [Pirellulales bacterium]|nr:hypothetical protein [Pirellulales bacterium]